MLPLQVWLDCISKIKCNEMIKKLHVSGLIQANRDVLGTAGPNLPLIVF